MSRPSRIQLQRTRGWRMPADAIVVARPSKWGNPFKVGEPSPWGEHAPMTRAEVVHVYRYMIGSTETLLGWGEAGWEADHVFAGMARNELRGHDLACWCPLDEPCHADVLIDLANS